jgi:hypothetical protein
MKKLLILLLCVAAAIGAAAGVNRAPITEQPEGELVTYTRSGNAVYNHGGTYRAVEQSGEMDIVYDPDGTTVYLKNIIFKSDSLFGDYWVQGTLNENGTAISVLMDQKLYRVGTTNIYIKLAWGTSTYRVHNGEQYFNFNVDESVNRAIYTINGNIITLQNSYTDDTAVNPEFRGTGLGCVLSSSNQSFGGFMEWNTVLTGPPVLPTVITEIPDNCTIYTYGRQSSCIWNSFGFHATPTTGRIVVAFDTEHSGVVYIQDLMWHENGSYVWVKGSYDRRTGIISIPTGQYLDWNDSFGYGRQLGWGRTYVETVVNQNGDEDYDLIFALDEDVTEIQLMIDGDYLYLLGTEGDIDVEFPENYVATGMLEYWSDDHSGFALEFCTHDEYGYDAPFGFILRPAVPADPTADDWYDCGDESGYSKFSFTFPTTDVEGVPIDQTSMAYSIYLDDDQLFTFDADTYSYNLDEDMTEIDYDVWGMGYDFRSSYCYFYRTNAEGYEPLFNWRIGIQVHYTVDGVKNSSNIVYLEVFPNPNAKLGDVNNDGAVNIADVTSLIDYLLSQSPGGVNLTNADVNQDQAINIADVTALIDKLLSGN